MKKPDMKLVALFFCVVAANSSAMSATPVPVRGELCVKEQRHCIQWPSERDRLSTDVVGQPFVFVAEGARSVVVGLVPKEIAEFQPAATDGGLAALKFHPLSRKHAATPVTLRVEQAKPPISWVHTMQPREASSVRELRLPDGAYTLVLTADRHFPLQRELRVRSDATTALGELSLREAPVMTGRVVDKKTGEPLANAIILAAENQTLATTDAAGMFEISLIDEGLREIVVEAPGRAPKHVNLRDAITASSLGDIAVSQAGVGVVNLAFPESVRKKVTVTVMDTADPNEHVIVASAPVEPNETQARFEELEPGRYIAIVEGENALERFAVDLPIVAGESNEQTATIRPSPIVIRTRLGDEALPDATVQVTHMTSEWKTEVHTDSAGEYGAVLWQPGTFLGALTAAQVPQPHVVFAEIGATDTTWELTVPDRRIVGRVIDRDSSRPIAAASLVLSTQTTSGDITKINVGATTREDGSFEFTAVKPGRQTMTVTARGYVRPEPVEFLVEEHDRRIERILELTAGVTHHLRIRNSQGAPLAGAAAYAVSGDAVVGNAFSDASGEAALPVPSRVPVAAYVFPRDGSFAVVRLPAIGDGEDSQEISVTVPPALASLLVSVKDSSGQPIEGVWCLVRYEGEFLLPSVLAIQRPWRPSGDGGDAILPQLPSGYYELWPYRSVNEALAIIGAGGQSPLRLGLQVSPGLNRATLELRPTSNNLPVALRTFR